ncbi:hypothetical protein O9K51_00194 [Purpureocillium lavendulum]|uniref:Uncharacterized protein n=1 Tax=Purpureocillium lavendulum TaxID=1247861 RepID=A0AB34G2E1_9HYPO|nr:hypothetical protein O9K51_00194 [Purpureocillium lavendulum]
MEYTDPVTGALKQREWTEVRPQCKIMNNDGLFLLAYMTSKTAEYTAEDSYTRVANVSTGTIAFQTTTERFVERIYVDEYGSAAPRFRTHGSIGRDVWTTSWNVLAWDKHIFKATSRENGLIMCLQTEPRYQGRPITRSGVDITAVQEAINASVGHEQPCVHGDGDMLLFVSNRGILLWTFGVRLRTAWRSG